MYTAGKVAISQQLVTPGFPQCSVTILSASSVQTLAFIEMKHSRPPVNAISPCQWNLMKTYHNEANTSRITKIASKNFLEFLKQSS